MDTKIVINPSIARQLLHKGHAIIDIKPKKENIRETMFVFENTEEFKKDLENILNI